ncbi:MAG: hypothetical protein V4633_13560 [Pseudomonadota bacterium]
MRTTSISSVQFTPGNPPADPAQLQRYLIELEMRISVAINALAAGHLDKSYVAPTKPRDGDIRYADGTSWVPGAGAGIYWFNGTVWTKL